MTRTKLRHGIALALCHCLAGLAGWRAAGCARGDTLDLVAGDHLIGRIVSVCSSNVTFTNAYAGTLHIERGLVSRLTTDEPVRLALTNGDRLLGRVAMAGTAGQLAITTSNAERHVVATGAVVAVWLPGAVDPTLPPRRFTWKNNATFELHGQSGNTRSFYAGGGVESTVSTTNMDLKLYGRGSDGTSDDVLNERKLASGADFEQRFARVHSLYMRDEAEKDEIAGIRLRNMLFYGYGYYVYRDPDRSLRLRVGLGHTLTEYVDQEKKRDTDISADSGLKYRQKLGKYASWSTEVIYEPVVRDTSNYYVTHESLLSLPLAMANLTEEFGISNNYLSQPGSNTKPLDTTYFIRTRYAW